MIAIILILLIIVIVIIILNNYKIVKIPEVTVTQIFQNTPIVSNPIPILTTNDINNNNNDLMLYKHNRFLKNLDNSIDFCIDSNKFILADNIDKYKKLYLEIYEIKKKYSDINELNKNEEFLLKNIRLEKLNNIIQNSN